MIAGNLENVMVQVAMNPRLKTAFDFLRDGAWEALPEGRFEIEGSKLWGMVQRYETEATPINEFETHRRHIDFHYLVEGEETIYWIPADLLSSDGVYDETRDVWITTLAGDAARVTRLELRAGELIVFFPSDGHWPRRARQEPAQVKKILIKIPLD